MDCRRQVSSSSRDKCGAAGMIVFEEGKAPDFTELVAFLNVLDALEERPYNLPVWPWTTILRLGLLTGARAPEIVGIRWSDERPLSEAANAILRSVPRRKGVDRLFPDKNGDVPLEKAGRVITFAISETLAGRGFDGGFTFGRLRKSLASWLDFQSEATDGMKAIILGYKMPRPATSREELQTWTLLDKWSAAIDAARAAAPSNVVSIFSRRAVAVEEGDSA
jgi:integrase